jgi:hypothetical protein
MRIVPYVEEADDAANKDSALIQEWYNQSASASGEVLSSRRISASAPGNS